MLFYKKFLLQISQVKNIDNKSELTKNNQSIKNEEDAIPEAKTPPLPIIKAINGTSTTGKFRLF